VIDGALLYSALIMAGLAVWLVLTVVNQVRRGARIAAIKQRDVLALIPTWTFFAPRPGVTDHNLLYRDRGPAGDLSAWRQVRPPDASRLRWLWNPTKRERKSVSDLSQSLVRSAARPLGNRLYIQLSYVLLLNLVAQARPSAFAVERQFIVVRSYGFARRRAPQILFASDFHVLDDPAA
jgi:hypothetical protein